MPSTPGAPTTGPTRAARDAAPTTVTVGVVGRPVRADVSHCGDVTPWGPGASTQPSATWPTLSWSVAAEDRWHTPATETSVRQRRLSGTPVVETRLRVPDGDVVQLVWSVADRGGLTVVEVRNESPLPIAVAFSGAPLLTERQPSGVAPRGIDLPAGSIVLPVGHRAAVRVGLAFDAAADAWAAGPLPPVAGPETVERGWLTTIARASRLELPDEPLVASVTAARCDLLLDGPSDPNGDPVGFLHDIGELVRLGDDPSAWLPDVVGPVEAIARRDTADVTAALVAAGRVARAAGDQRALGDVERLLRRRGDPPPVPVGSFAELRRTASAGRFVHDAEALLSSGGELLPRGIPRAWLGSDFAVHGVPSGPSSTVSFAVRWHGPRPAVLWEQTGPPVELTAPAVDPAWSSDRRTGEALWAAPAARPPRPLTAR